jgi:hypothetical protein
MSSLDRIVFVRRQSPDWVGLMRDHEAGRFIAPARYSPPAELPGFPDDIAGCIRVWNDTFALNFFRCRAILKSISEHSIRQVRNSILLTDDRLFELPDLVADSCFLLFFFDDDDWFVPDMFERLSALDLEPCDITVFPLIRIGAEILTFVRKDEKAAIVLGERTNFGYRFHTNNYGIASKIALSGHLPNLQDHILGSRYVDMIKLPDRYFDIIISLTNKTPCAASSMKRLPIEASAYRAAVQRFVKNLESIHFPPGLERMTSPLQETILLFSKL